MKKILLIDEGFLIDRFKPEIESWGYKLIGISKSDFIEEVVKRHHIDLLIIAREMRIAGPSLFESELAQPDAPMEEHLLKLFDTKIDFEWGLKVIDKISAAKLAIPYIFLTTEDEIKETQWKKNMEGKIVSAIVPKFSMNFYNDLHQAVIKILESSGIS